MRSRSRFNRTFLVQTVAAIMLVLMGSVDALAVTRLWTRTYNGTSNNRDEGWGVAVAADGSIYVTGSTYSPEKSYSLLLQKYSPAGALLWAKSHKGASIGAYRGNGVAVAADGSIYVTGVTYVPGQFSGRLLLRKYSPTGAMLWTRTYSGASDGYAYGSGVAVAADGSVYVTGATYVTGQSFNLLVRKYSPAGALLWMKTFSGASSDFDIGDGVAVAADGGVHVTGMTYVAGQSQNLLLREYSPAGVMRWTKTYNGASDRFDGGFGVAVAADGSIYVTGYTDVAGQAYNLLLQKYR